MQRPSTAPIHAISFSLYPNSLALNTYLEVDGPKYYSCRRPLRNAGLLCMFVCLSVCFYHFKFTIVSKLETLNFW